ncbi:hypothetical protein J2S43_002551 [Catenuloplanes nepalensis]|uniref:Uncharacterized protein n=1 Tax=Catenuloplanes nepalensis TaxID=587533 RepID=A0ABT9MRI4_9ACTN|nr:hypothetical protein [Catenuloplanes nepalensis]MDP9794039.1 hypothetical protein [Catenuloplanes nepalensis]
MDSSEAVSRKSRAGRVALTVVLVLLALSVLAGRWLSPNLLFATKAEQLGCQGGFCVERVHRGERLFLAPRDEIWVSMHDGARFYSAKNPFGDGDTLTVDWAGGGVRVTDGTVSLSWDAATLARLGD